MCFSVNEMFVFGKLRYRILKERTADENGAVCFTYGIELIRDGKSVRRISDITCAYSKIRKLCSFCNCHNLSAVHIDDVIEDFLCD